MELFQWCHEYDYGHEWYLNVIYTKYVNLFQFNLNWNCYNNRPIILVNILGESLFGFSITFGKFDFSFDFLSYHPRDLRFYTE